jgi:hypothetical protein
VCWSPAGSGQIMCTANTFWEIFLKYLIPRNDVKLLSENKMPIRTRIFHHTQRELYLNRILEVLRERINLTLDQTLNFCSCCIRLHTYNLESVASRVQRVGREELLSLWHGHFTHSGGVSSTKEGNRLFLSVLTAAMQIT